MSPFLKPNNTFWLRQATWLVLGSAAVTLALIFLGVFDPKPLGTQAWSIQPGAVRVDEETQSINWLDDAPDLPPTYTLRLTAAHLNGEQDSSYGLIVGKRENPLIVAVSPLGYVTIKHEGKAILPWQTWPHVKTGSQANEIWLYVQPSGTTSQITIRLNRELLWSGEVALSGTEVGLMVESFEDTTTADFQHLELFIP